MERIGATKKRSVSTAAKTSNDPLHIRWRPKLFSEVIGQDPVVASLKKVLRSDAVPHSYLFTGPSGVGKTTLARIVAAQLGCTDVVEVDAATNTGIDAMRQVTESLRYTPMSEGSRMIIIDECHSLSKQAWQSLLKAVEEPPPHSYFCFCTTESDKVPKTIVTRCFSYALREVPARILFDYLATVVSAEDLEADEDLIDVAAQQAEGSVRKALVNLSKVAGCASVKDAESILESAAGISEVIDLCRLLVSGRLTWPSAQALVKSMQDQNPESIRIIVTAYVGKVLLGAKEADAVNLLAILDEFSQPFNSNEKMAPVLLALGHLLWR